MIASLIEVQQLDQAESICRRKLSEFNRGEEAYAKWSIELSAVLVSAALGAGKLDAPEWQAARTATDDALKGYEDQPASPWLRFQKLLVSNSENKFLAIVAMEHPEESPFRQTFLEAHVDTTSQLRQLADEIETQIPSLRQSTQSHGYASDLQNLLVSIRKTLVESSLLVADLYPSGSDDAIAAAVSADRDATELLEETTYDSIYREQVIRLLARAKCESQQAGEASRLLQPYVGTARTTAPDTLAIWLLSLWMQGERDQVAGIFRDYYSSDPMMAPSSIHMDLLRLRTLLDEIPVDAKEPQVSQINQTITQWVELIGRRGGPYARRRAEIQLLRAARDKPTTTSTTLLVAEAGQRIRSNQPESLIDASELLLQASSLAAAGNDLANAFRWGAQAAAVLNRAGKIEVASEVLAKTASTFPNQPEANRYHLEAIRMLSTTFDKQASTAESRTRNDSTAAKIEQMLLVHLREWPQLDSALAARTWLLGIYDAEQRWQDAAQVCIKLPNNSVEWEKAIEQASTYWLRAINDSQFTEARREIALQGIRSLGILIGEKVNPMTSSPDEHGVITPDKQSVITPDKQSVITPDKQSVITPDKQSVTIPDEQRFAVKAQIDLLIVLGLNPDELADHWISTPSTTKVGDASPLRFAAELRRLRYDDVNPDQLALSPPNVSDRESIIDAAMTRLVADGKETQGKRVQLARGIQRIAAELPTNSLGNPHAPQKRERDFLLAVANAWSGNWQSAANEFDRISQGPPKDGKFLERGASILMELGNRDASKKAAELWSRIASGLKPGEPRWYQARLGSAQALASAGEIAEATKIAQYVLLIHPPDDTELKSQFTELAQQQP